MDSTFSYDSRVALNYILPHAELGQNFGYLGGKELSTDLVPGPPGLFKDADVAAIGKG